MLSGLGDVAFSVISGILEVAGRVGFASIFMFVLKMSYFGIWYTNVLTWFLIALSAISRFIYYIRQVEQGKVSIKILHDINLRRQLKCLVQLFRLKN